MLANIKRGKLVQAQRILIYGTPGIGKSTFAGQAPDPVFLGADAGTGHLDVARFPEPKSWDDVVKCVKEYAKESHDYKTLVLDPVTFFEPLAYAHVCKLNGWDSIESAGYGKGYAVALDLWRRLISDLELVWSKGSNVVLVAHSQIKTFKNPESDDFDRYIPLMNDKLSGVLQSWCDAVLFACYDVSVSKERKGLLRGGRILRTTYCPAFDAKNRLGLPDTMPLAWIDPTPIEPQIDALLAEHPIHAPKVRQLMRGADYVAMREILAKLKAKCAASAAGEVKL